MRPKSRGQAQERGIMHECKGSLDMNLPIFSENATNSTIKPFNFIKVKD